MEEKYEGAPKMIVYLFCTGPFTKESHAWSTVTPVKEETVWQKAARLTGKLKQPFKTPQMCLVVI